MSEDYCRTRLSEKDWQRIRMLKQRDYLTNAQLAKRFGVSYQLIMLGSERRPRTR